MLEIRVGCCGFPVARLKYYESLDTVEIQQTLYHGRSGYHSRHDSKDLQKVLEMCEGKTYCFFNHRFMFEDGIEFLRLVQARSESA